MATHASSPDYSLVDEPVGSLAAHYHTRGALNFVLYGTTTFNDGAGVVNDTLTSGELRFVDAGVYYGRREAVGDGTRPTWRRCTSPILPPCARAPSPAPPRPSARLRASTRPTY